MPDLTRAKLEIDDETNMVMNAATGLPIHLPRKARFQTNTLKGIRTAMGSVTSAIAHGRLDPMAGRNIVQLLTEVSRVLERERRLEALEAKLARLEQLLATLPQASQSVDVAAIRQAMMDDADG
ncbi:hypothetical protein HKCCSP123_06155 [Rhodobacterales bacterium HKCCSP123]|nr:hypothetical protein [Rhodobacterales bacterium HKCCSP123]